MNNKYFEYLNEISNNYYPIAGSDKNEYDQLYRQNMIPNSFNEMINMENYIENLNNENKKNNNCGLYSTYEGFFKGNMFPELYSPYKGYRPKEIKAKNEQEALMLQIDELCFALIDINLYLDVYPNDNCMIKLYNNILDKKKRVIKEYENKYGPITTNSNELNKTPWAFDQVKSPWERGY